MESELQMKLQTKRGHRSGPFPYIRFICSMRLWMPPLSIPIVLCIIPFISTPPYALGRLSIQEKSSLSSELRALYTCRPMDVLYGLFFHDQFFPCSCHNTAF